MIEEGILCQQMQNDLLDKIPLTTYRDKEIVQRTIKPSFLKIINIIGAGTQFEKGEMTNYKGRDDEL